MLKEANKVLDPRMQLCAKAQKLDYSKRAQFPEAPYKIQSSFNIEILFLILRRKVDKPANFTHTSHSV